MPVKVKFKDGTEVLLEGFSTKEELRLHYEDMVRSRIEESKFEEFEKWLESEQEVACTGEYSEDSGSVLNERSRYIPHRDIMEVYREEGKRGGGPSESTGESKDRKIMADRARKERFRVDGNWDDNL